MRVAVAPFLVALAASIVVACGDPEPVPEAPIEPSSPTDPTAGLEPWSDAWVDAHAARFLEGDAGRREALEASLTNPENLYSQTRLATYARGRSGWDALPVWNPRVKRIDGELAAALARGEQPAIGDDVARFWDGRAPGTHAEWVALGERVFFELPLRSEPFWEVALRDPARGEALGVERAPDGSVPGLVRMRDDDGSTRTGITCALCHTARAADGETIIAGRGRRTLDYGRIRIAFYEQRGAAIDPRSRARWESWGPGRADVLEDVADVPIAIPDLWALRDLRVLTHAGTLGHTTPLALAIRQETQYVQANHLHTRPPRELMWALALYLYSLEPPPARAFEGTARDHERAGAIFARACGRCHGSAVGSGALVPVAEVGTDPELATGNARGTGHYRPAPLLRVADAAPYLHHGVIDSLESLLDPARDEHGHRFGMELEDSERALLIAYLRAR